MSQKTDWMEGTRSGQLSMAKNWISILTAKGDHWSVQDAVTAELSDLTEDAEKALEKAKNEASRTPVATAECKAAFAALAAFMRDAKRRYFLSPPLTDADFVSLGLKPKDTTHTPSGTPTSQVTIETYLVGRHELGVKTVYVTGSPEEAANKGYRIYYSIAGQGETAPRSPEELKTSFYTKRKKDVIEFGFNDSGKTAYMAVQIENDGKKGPWGSARISVNSIGTMELTLIRVGLCNLRFYSLSAPFGADKRQGLKVANFMQ